MPLSPRKRRRGGGSSRSGPRRSGHGRGPTRPRHWAAALAGALLLAAPAAARAQNVQDGPGSLGRTIEFLGGAVAGLGIHESGHVAFDLMFHAHPHTRGISFRGIPFFDIDHDLVSRRKTYVIAAAGLWMQGLSAEWLLTRDPDLHHHKAPFRKGMFAFHIATSLVYVGASFGRTGPTARDTYGMARSLGTHGVPEPYVGALVLAPAALDAYRYFHPDAHWAVWASRLTKAAAMALTLEAR